MAHANVPDLWSIIKEETVILIRNLFSYVYRNGSAARLVKTFIGPSPA